MATPCALPTWRRASLRFVAAAVLLLALPAAAQQSTVAAVFYSQTNEPAGNSIVVTTVSTTGTLSYLTSVSTGGVGVGGTAVADALFSQDAVKVGDNYLFAVNAGSNTLSTFSITNFGLTLTLLNTAATQGTFPVSVAYSSKLKVACVLNGGVTNGVACFTVSATGATFASKVLLSVSGLSDTPTGAAGTLSDIVFDPASAQVLVSLKGTPTTPGTLYVIPVGAGGMLGAAVANTVSPSRVFFSLTNIGGSSAWGFSDAAFGYGTFTLSGTSVTGAAAVPLVSNHANCWTAWAPQSGRLLVIDGAGIVTAVSVASGASPVTSTVLGNFSVSTGLLDSTVAVVAGTEYLLGVSQNLVGVVSLKLGSNGVPTAQQSSVTLTGVAVNSKRLQGAAVYLSVASTSSASSWGASALRVPALAAAVLVAAAVLAL